MVAKQEVKDGAVCGFELVNPSTGKLGGCGCEAVVTFGGTPLCAVHAEYVASVDSHIEYTTPVGNNHHVKITKDQFMQEAGLV